jgi:NAD(P)-dependent dehydrogenase (short-subunit alcohol dehydrogenase family)
VDVTDREAVAAALEGGLETPHVLDALVNCAAVQPIGSTLEQGSEVWRATMATNVESVAIMVQATLPELQRGRGSVVNIASVHAMATSGDIGVYAASKGAVVALTRALALELAPRGIRVNAVLPGAVDTEMLREGLGRSSTGVDHAMQALAERTVLGRIGEPWEIASAVRFLADPEMSSFITGSSLVVDGGALARLSTE